MTRTTIAATRTYRARLHMAACVVVSIVAFPTISHGQVLEVRHDVVSPYVNILKNESIQRYLDLSSGQIDVVEQSLAPCPLPDVISAFRCEALGAENADAVADVLTGSQSTHLVALLLYALPSDLIESPDARGLLEMSPERHELVAEALKEYEYARLAALDDMRRIRFPSSLAAQRYFLSRTYQQRAFVVSLLTEQRSLPLGALSSDSVDRLLTEPVSE
jgi:hypothetical protein